MTGKSRALIQCSGVGEYMSTASSIDVETNHLLANGTLCRKGVKPSPPYEFEEFNHPHEQQPHASAPSASALKLTGHRLTARVRFPHLVEQAPDQCHRATADLQFPRVSCRTSRLYHFDRIPKSDRPLSCRCGEAVRRLKLAGEPLLLARDAPETGRRRIMPPVMRVDSIAEIGQVAGRRSDVRLGRLDVATRRLWKTPRGDLYRRPTL